MPDLKHTVCDRVQITTYRPERPFFIFYILCNSKIRSSKSVVAEVSCTYIRGKKRSMLNAAGLWSSDKKGLPTHSFGKLSHPLNAALLYLCIKKCRSCKRNVRQSLWEGMGILSEFLKCRRKNKMQIRCVSISCIEKNKLNFHTDLQELISIWQVVIVLSCQIV